MYVFVHILHRLWLLMQHGLPKAVDNFGKVKEALQYLTLTCLVRCKSLSYSFLVFSLLPSLISKSMYDCKHRKTSAMLMLTEPV